MQCNIDAKGKIARLISGILTLIGGVVFIILAAAAICGPWAWWVGGGTIAGGMFQIYEGWAGWCVMRAMGFKTPM